MFYSEGRQRERAIISLVDDQLFALDLCPKVDVSGEKDELIEGMLNDQVQKLKNKREIQKYSCTLIIDLEAAHQLLLHPDSSIRQQVYQEGVLERCLSVMQLMEQLSFLRRSGS